MGELLMKGSTMEMASEVGLGKIVVEPYAKEGEHVTEPRSNIRFAGDGDFNNIIN